MNDTSSLLKDKEELVKEIAQFPIEFQSGSPGSVFDRITVQSGEKKAKVTSSLSELVKDMRVLASFVPDIGRSIERQIQRLINDLKKSPKNVYILNNLGKTYVNIGKLNEAIECFQQALAIDNNFRLAMKNLAKAYMMQDKAVEALSIYLEYIKKNPDDDKALIDLAHIYLRLEKLDDARATIDQSLSLTTNNPNAHHTSGILHLIKGEVDKAISTFRRATYYNSHFSLAYNALGVCYAIKRNFPKAIRYLKIAYAIDPQVGHIVKNLAKVYQEKGDFESSATLLFEYIKKNPRDWEAQNGLAHSYFKMGEYKRSLEILQTIARGHFGASATGDKYAAILNNMGVVYLHMGLVPLAEDMFNQSLDVSEKPNPIAYFNLTRMLTDLGRREEAKRLIKEYMDIAPGDQTPLILLSQNYIHEGEYHKAKEILDDILIKYPLSRDASVLSSVLNSEVFEEYDSAIKTIEQVISDNKPDQILLNDLAYCHIKKDSLESANDILNGINWEEATFPLYATKGLLQIAKGRVAEGTRLYNMAVGKAPNNELKNMVRQKRNIELARYLIKQGKIDEALRQLHNTLSIKTRSKLYLDQADRMLKQIEELPKQSRLPFPSS